MKERINGNGSFVERVSRNLVLLLFFFFLTQHLISVFPSLA